MMSKTPSLSLPRFAGEGTLTISAVVDEGRNLLPLPRQRGRAGVGALALMTMLVITPAYAVTPGEKLPDPAMEARARAITSELRCLVCQNQSVDDSDASLAKDLRVLVRDKLKEGMSDAEVKEYVHSRYGDFVLLRPPVKPGTILLWTAPLIALLAGGAAVWSAARRRRAPAGPAPLTAEEHERLKALGVEERE
ncbi:cytochrome c-type biogenesis protein [Methylocystis parvus]|uniref:cytochrome c-type biogenesis protein n=1 Tax=Methylocystis parvus TaxID=134 RepID=UPI003C754661